MPPRGATPPCPRVEHGSGHGLARIIIDHFCGVTLLHRVLQGGCNTRYTV